MWGDVRPLGAVGRRGAAALEATRPELVSGGVVSRCGVACRSPGCGVERRGVAGSSGARWRAAAVVTTERSIDAGGRSRGLGGGGFPRLLGVVASWGIYGALRPEWPSRRRPSVIQLSPKGQPSDWVPPPVLRYRWLVARLAGCVGEQVARGVNRGSSALNPDWQLARRIQRSSPQHPSDRCLSFG